MSGSAGTVRITGGTLRGRKLKVLPLVRPAKDQVRQAIFSAVGPVVNEARVLDLFCGSGAYGVEAMSRGADSLVAVDRNTSVVKQLQASVHELLPGANVQVQCNDAVSYISHYRGEPFSLVFIDPPYSMTAEFIADGLPGIAKNHLVDVNSVVIFESSRDAQLDWAFPWECFWQRRYGVSLISMLRLQRDIS